MAGSSDNDAATQLLKAAEYGREDVVRNLLRKDPTAISAKTPDGDTALHVAILNRHQTVLEILLESGGDTEIPDSSGRKALQFAVERESDDLVAVLLKFKADVESLNTLTHVSALYRAVDTENLGIAALLLEHGANVDARDPLGGTPLFRAVIKDNVPLAELLLQHGADRRIRRLDGLTVNDFAKGGEEMMCLLLSDQLLQGPSIRPADDGAKAQRRASIAPPPAPTENTYKMSAVHGFRATVVDFFIGDSEKRIQSSVSVHELLYGNGPEEIMKEARRGRMKGESCSFRWYHLPANNMEWVEALMRRHFADRNSERQDLSDDMKLKLGLLSRGQGKNQWSSAPQSSFMRSSCRTVKAEESGSNPESNTRHVVAFVPFLHYETQGGSESMTEAIRTLHSDPEPQEGDAEKSGPGSRAGPKMASPSPLKSLSDNLFKGYLRPEGEGHAPPLQNRRTLDRYLYVHLDTQDGRDGDQVVLRYTKNWAEPKLFMVDQLWLWILSDDTVITCFPTTWKGEAKVRSVHSRNSNPPSVVSHAKVKAAPHPPRRPPAQPALPGGSQWTSPLGIMPLPPGAAVGETPEDVAAWQREREVPKDHQSEISFLAEDDPLDVLQNIFKHLKFLRREPITSAHALASLITNFCVEVFDPHEVPEEFQFFDFFERSIGSANDRAVQQLRRFRTTLGHLDNERSKERQIHQRLSIKTEISLLVEIDDIRDELGILRMVLQDQQAVLKDMSTTLERQTNDDGNNPHPAPDAGVDELSLKKNRVLESLLHRIEKMDTLASKTSASLTDLLDLKQKQASITEALSQRMQAVLAANHAKTLADQSVWQREQSEATARQGKTVLLFTVVTIVFLPMSLIVSFFTINIDSFPYDANGRISLDYVLKFVLSISAGASIPFILIIFNLDRVWRILKLIRIGNYISSSSKWIFFGSLTVLIVSLVLVWTSKLAMGFKIAMTVAISLLLLIVVVAYGIHRLVSTARQPMSFSETSSTSSGLILDD